MRNQIDSNIMVRELQIDVFVCGHSMVNEAGRYNGVGMATGIIMTRCVCSKTPFK